MNEKENKKKKELIVDIDRDIVVENNRGIEREITLSRKEVEEKVVDDAPHDTVGLICLDCDGRLACGTSTSGYVRRDICSLLMSYLFLFA